ncbi:hypothetical protein V5K00_RS22100 [Enterobacter asburiae]
MKFFSFIILMYCSVSLADSVPETHITLNADEYAASVGQGYVGYAQPVTLEVLSSLLGEQGQEASLQLNWQEQCTPLKGSMGLDIHVEGFRNVQENSDSIQITPTNLSFTTKIWLNLVRNNDSLSTAQEYECDVIGTEYWPVPINHTTVSKLNISIEMQKPSCSISAPGKMTLSPLSDVNPTSTETMPVSVKCEGYPYPPRVFLTLKGGMNSNNDNLYEDDNILFEMLYGDDNSSLTGQHWRADGLTRYAVGEVETTKTIEPLIKSTMKESAKAGDYKATATIMLNVE